MLIFLDDKDNILPLGDIQSFENEWMEVEIRHPLNWGSATSPTALNVPNTNNDRDQGVPHFLCENIDALYLQGDYDFDCNYAC